MPITAEINERIDQVLTRNKMHEIAILLLAAGIFMLGLGALTYGIYVNQALIVAPSTLITACLYWPIKMLIKIRKENIALAAAPSLIAVLPPDEAARELIKLLAKLT